MEEEDEQAIRNSFLKVKEEISSLKSQIGCILNEIENIKKALLHFPKINNYKIGSSGRRDSYDKYNGLSRKI